MSEFNEELLNDVDDYPDIGDADEDALLQDDEDGDVLDLVPEEDIGESLEDSRLNPSEQEEEKEERGDKFAVERQRITAPEPSVEESNTPKPNNRFQRPNNRGHRGRGRFQNNGRGKFAYANQSGRNKTVLINPRFQGVVHVNNNARLAWDTPQQQQYQPNPWVTGTPPGHMGRSIQPFQGGQSMPGPPIQAGPSMQQQQIQGFHGPPFVQPNFHGPPMQPFNQEPQMQQGPMQPIQNIGQPGHQLQYIPPQQQQQQQPFMPQPLPPGVQQGPMQGPNQPGNPFMQGNYQSSLPILINTGHPPPQTPPPNYQHYNQHSNSPMMQQNFNPNQNFAPQNQPVFPNNMNNVQYNRGNMGGQNKRDWSMQKRKGAPTGVPQNKKVFVRERLGPAPQSQVRIKSEERPSVVKEVTTVTNVTVVKIEEDEETRDLRLKIEEQKRKREAILQWKEKRRLENLGKSPAADQKVITQIQAVQQSPVKMEQKSPQRRPVQKSNFQQAKHHVQPVRQVVQPVTAQGQNWPAKIKKQSNNIVITNGFSRKYTQYQKTNKFSNNQNVNVVVTLPMAPPAVPEPEVQPEKEVLSSNFLADRKILAKDESLMSTRKVLIKNISTSTGDKRLFNISKNIGVVQKLHREKNERQATITFKSVASAHAFFKKYQRHMLDLSMIEVSLIPMTESDE